MAVAVHRVVVSCQILTDLNLRFCDDSPLSEDMVDALLAVRGRYLRLLHMFVYVINSVQIVSRAPGLRQVTELELLSITGG